MVEKLSKKKIEKIAGEELIKLINEIKSADYNIKFDEKGISWDGYIDIYSSNDIDNKDNYIASLDVQIKGRTVYKEKSNSISFSIDKIDLKNYLKKNGTLFFVTTINLNKSNSKRIFGKALLREEINKLLKEKGNNSTINVKLKLIKNSVELERMLYNFNKDRVVQSRISEKVLNNNNLFMDKAGYRYEFYEYNKTDIFSIVGNEKYVYEFDSNDNVIGCSKLFIDSIKYKNDIEITTIDKNIIYNTVEITNKSTDVLINFGKAFVIKNNENIEIKIQGTFNERLKDLRFINKIIEDKVFIIANHKIKLGNIVSNTNFKEMQKQYEKINNFLLKHNIKKDLDFDNWDEEKYKQLLVLIDGFENHDKLKSSSWNNSMLGRYKINDLSISIIAQKQEDNAFFIETIFNNSNVHDFKLEFGDKLCKTSNKFLAISREVYLCDDLNIDEIKESLDSLKIDEDIAIIINKQALELLFAYDISMDKRLLDLANYYFDLIKEYDDDDINILNKYQVKIRNSELSEEDLNVIYKIKENSCENLIKIGCNILLNNKNEAKLLINKMSEEEKKILYKDFPIINLLNNKNSDK